MYTMCTCEVQCTFIDHFRHESGSRWMSIEGKYIWTVPVINECHVYCFSLR